MSLPASIAIVAWRFLKRLVLGSRRSTRLTGGPSTAGHTFAPQRRSKRHGSRADFLVLRLFRRAQGEKCLFQLWFRLWPHLAARAAESAIRSKVPDQHVSPRTNLDAPPSDMNDVISRTSIRFETGLDRTGALNTTVGSTARASSDQDWAILWARFLERRSVLSVGSTTAS